MAEAPEAKDHPRGYVGWVYEEAFQDLYKQKLATTISEDAGAEEGVADGGKTYVPEEVNTSAEDAEIAAIQASVAAEQARLSDVLGYIKEKRTEAFVLDRQDAEFLQTRWGLTMREQVPVGESKLRSLLDGRQIQKEGLILPRSMMTELERRTEINKGTVPQHDNLLAISKPDEPNYFKETSSLKLRNQARNVEPHLTEEQKQLLTDKLVEHHRQKPRMPPQLNAEERAKKPRNCQPDANEGMLSEKSSICRR